MDKVQKHNSFSYAVVCHDVSSLTGLQVSLVRGLSLCVSNIYVRFYFTSFFPQSVFSLMVFFFFSSS
jgi:hypothetical protein